MKIKKVNDERVVQLNNKIQKEAYFVVLFLAAASLIIKTYVMEMSFTHYAAELGIIVLSSLYIAVRSMFLGHDFCEDSRNSRVLNIFAVLGLSLIVSIANGVKNYSLYGDKYTGILDVHFILVLAVTFISSAVFISMALGLLYALNKAGQQRLEKKLNDED